jgi:hypothetical protein
VKYKIAIIPAADEERLYDGVSTIAEAQEVSKKYAEEIEGPTSLDVFTFDTAKELNAFVQGYEAMVGWVGNGRFITEDPK